MAKLGMGKVTSAKDLERELARIAKENAPKEDAFRRIAAALMASSVDYFESAIRQYVPTFLHRPRSEHGAHESSDDHGGTS